MKPSEEDAGKDSAKTQKPPTRPAAHYRSLFISDLHMGARSCQVDRILDFIKRNNADTIYLVGDIVDTWTPIGRNWSPAHDEVLHILLRRAQEGARLVYLPGNHDAFFRSYFGTYFDCIEIADHVYHEAADGRSYLVLHGDAADGFFWRRRLLSRFGGFLDHIMRGLSDGLNEVRRTFGLAETSKIENTIARFNRMLRYGNRFEKRLAALARQHDRDGVICGHFHKAALHSDWGVVYANCGDWVESFTAIAETMDGQLHLLKPVSLTSSETRAQLALEFEDEPRTAI